MRLLGDAGLPTARSVGIVELTPDREYLLVTEFFDGADEIGDAEVDDQIIDEGLALMRQLWNAGVAHRDIKPANLLVKDGHLLPHRRRLRPGPPVAVAGGGRPRQHDARPRRPHRPRTRLPARPRLLHPRRDRRGVRRRPGHRQPDAAADDAQEGRPRPRRPVPSPRPATSADLAATLGTCAASSSRSPCSPACSCSPRTCTGCSPPPSCRSTTLGGPDGIRPRRRAAPTT